MGLFPRCPDSLCGVDVDDLFAYSTNKMVTIRDARLGILHYFMMFLIVLYIVLYQLIALGGYLEKSVAQSTVRLTLQQPTINRSALAGHQTCNPNDWGCEDDFTQPVDLPYCKSAKKHGQFQAKECSFLDGSSASVVRANSIMMTTAVHKYAQERSTDCNTSSSKCQKLWNWTKDETSYIVDPESFTLMCDHSLTTIAVTPSEQKGYLHVNGGSSVQDQVCAEGEAYDGIWNGARTSKAPCYLTPKQVIGQDIFSIDLLLKSMGVSLDDRSLRHHSQNPKRYDGFVVNMHMEYSNFHTFHWGAEPGVRYVYRLKEVLPSFGYKSTRIVSTGYPDTREKEDNHGILFVVQATGELRFFSFTTLLLQLTTSLALIAIATTIVNILAQYVLAYSPFYNKAIYQLTHDFSDLRAACALADDTLEAELTHRGVRNIPPDRTERILALLDDGWTPMPTPSPSSENVQQAPATSLQDLQDRRHRAPLVSAGAV